MVTNQNFKSVYPDRPATKFWDINGVFKGNCDIILCMLLLSVVFRTGEGPGGTIGRVTVVEAGAGEGGGGGCGCKRGRG